VNTDPDRDRSERLAATTAKVIGCAFKVGNTLGPGFLEKVYENALAHELRKAGLAADQQHALTVLYDGVPVGECIPDILVERDVIVELKAIRSTEDIHQAICIHDLTATRLPVCLLINFSRRVEVRRFLGPTAPPGLALRSPPDSPRSDPPDQS
jgi:GxxExxY protein